MTIFSLYFSENLVISMGINVDGRKNCILDLLKFKVDLKYSSFNKHFLSMYIRYTSTFTVISRQKKGPNAYKICPISFFFDLLDPTTQS